MLDYRNQNLAHEIQKSEENKIAIIYGKLHLFGMVEELRKLA